MRLFFSLCVFLSLCVSSPAFAEAKLYAGWPELSNYTPPHFNGESGVATQVKLHHTMGGVFYKGDFYFADQKNRRIRKVNPQGFLQTVVGGGDPTAPPLPLGDGGSALNAGLVRPQAVEFDDLGNMYIADYHRIRKVDTNGIITTYAGNGRTQRPDSWRTDFDGYGGLATEYSINDPTEVKFLNGELYIGSADGLFFVTKEGYLYKVRFPGIHPDAYGFVVTGMAIDKHNNLYVTVESQTGSYKDYEYSIFRMFSDKSLVSIYLGKRQAVRTGVLETSGLIPHKISFDANGSLLVTDHDNHQVYKIYNGNLVKPILGTRAPDYVYLASPDAVTPTPDGKIIVTDTAHSNLYILDNPNDGPMTPVEGGGDVDGGCGLDATTDGEIFSCNPVNLATGTKVDQVVDLSHQTPYPIVWKRYYHSKKGDWTFEYQRSVVAAGSRLSMHRPDGVVLRFKKEAGVWKVDMGVNKTVVNVPSEVYVGDVLIGYEYRNLRDEVERYNTQGQLSYIQSREGWRLTMEYDGFGRLKKIVDSFGRDLKLFYTIPDNANTSFLTSVTDGERTIQYTYEKVNGKGLLTKVTRPDGRSVQYRYDNLNDSNSVKGRGLLYEIVDENGDVAARYNYDIFGRATQTLHDPDRLMVNKNEFFYEDTYGETTFIQNGEWGVAFVGKNWYTNGASKPRGLASPCASCQGSSLRRNNYDSYGNPVEQFDFNNVKRKNVYDVSRALPVEITEAVGRPGENTTEIQWHPQFRLPTQIIEEKLINDELVVMVTTNNYNADGQIISSIVSTSTGEEPRKQSVEYNTLKLPQVVTDNMGRKTSFQYDSMGNLISVTNSLGHTTNYSNYTVSGIPLLITLPNGLQRKISLNANQQIVKVEEGSAAKGWRFATMEYNVKGMLQKTTFSNGEIQENIYDTANRLISEKDGFGEKRYQYDEFSKIIKETVVLAPNNNFSNYPFNLETNYAYADYGNLSGVRNAERNLSYNYDFDGNVISVSSNTSTTDYVYDEFKQVVSETFHPDSLYPEETVTSNSREYYSNGLLKAAVDERGVRTGYKYNGFGELNQIISPDAGVTVLERNKIVKRTDGRGVVTQIERDSLGRPTKQTLLSPINQNGLSGGNQVQTFNYDSCLYGMGSVCGVDNYSGSINYSYNIWGEVTEKSITPAQTNLSLKMEYVYDPSGNLVSTRYPSGRAVTTTFSLGRPFNMSFDGKPIATQIKHYPHNWGVGAFTINQQNVVLARNSSGLISNILYFSSSVNNPYLAINLGWLNEGRFFSWDQVMLGDFLNRTKGDAMHYSKGYLERVKMSLPTSISTPSSQLLYQYRYDQGGNRTQKMVNSDTSSAIHYNYEVGSNRLKSTNQAGVGTVAYEYDAAGNVISGNGWTYLYDGENRMRQSSGNANVYYEYNGLGQRLKKTGPSGAEYFVYDEMGRVIGVYDDTGAVKEEFIWLEGWKPIATARGSGVSTKLYFIETDHLNAPNQIRDELGAIVWTWDFREPFGYHAPNEDIDGDGAYFEFNLRFPGQWFDKETGLFHNGFRDYNPSTGRYMQSDPLGLEAGFNTYAYVGSNPLRAVDPYGLDALDVHMKVSRGISWIDEQIVNGFAAVNAPAMPQGVVDFAAGWGDAASMGLTVCARNSSGTNQMVNHFSSSYNKGYYGGETNALFTGIGSGLKGINYALIKLVKSGNISLYHYTTKAAAESIAKNGLKSSNIGIAGKGVYTTPLPKPIASLLGAKSTEAKILINKSSQMSPTYVPGNIKVTKVNGYEVLP